MDQIVNVNEFQELAKQALPKMYYDFYSGGAEDQHTLKENVEAFRRIMFRPRVLDDVSKIDMSTNILGYPISAPIMIAPTGNHGLAHPQGETATAKAVAACNTIMIVSYMSTCTPEEIASSCNAVRFLQLYMYKRRDVTTQMVKRAEKAGFKALVLTVDVPRLGRREADIKNKMISPRPKNFQGLFSTEVRPNEGSGVESFVSRAFDASFSWKAYTPATITVLEEVVNAVRGRIPVLFDGGVRRGTYVFKALALGAKAVLVGRPIVYGLAAKGEDGVRKVIEMLKNEFEITMALSGCPTIDDINRNHVKTEDERLRSML